MKKRFIVTHELDDNNVELSQRHAKEDDDFVSAKWTINDHINVDIWRNTASLEADNGKSGNINDKTSFSYEKSNNEASSASDDDSNNESSKSYKNLDTDTNINGPVKRIGSVRQKETILLRKKRHNETVSLLHFLSKNLELLYDSIIPVPSLRDLDKKYVIGFTSFMIILMLSSFFYFFAITFISNLKYVNLSIDNNGICEPVAKSITGLYFGTYYGYWIGYDDYFYSFTFDKFRVTDSEFTSYISSIKENSLNELHDVSYNSPLDYSILYLMHYEYKYSSQRFKFYAQPNYVLQKDWTASGIASINGSCDTTPTVTYDLVKGQFLLSYDNSYGYYHSKFGEKGFDQTECSNITGNNLLFVDFSEKKISFNVFSHTATIAFNYGIAMNSVELQYPFLLANYTYENVVYSIHYRQFDNSDQVVCFKYHSGDRSVFAIEIDEYCFLELKNSLAIPILNNFGYYSSSSKTYNKCYCVSPGTSSTSDSTGEPVDTSEGCDSFDYMLGIIFSPQNNIDVLMKIITSYTQDEINSVYGYYASRYGLVYSYNYTYPYDRFIYTNGYNNSHDAFSFCDNQCAILVLENWMSSGKREINDKFVDLTTGSCNDIFTSPHFDNLGKDPPTTLTEAYYKCTQSTWQSFVTASGVAYGNVGLLFPIFIIVLVPLLYFYLVIARKLPPEEVYSHKEKLSAIEELGEILLLIRDGEDSNLEKNSTVYKLAQNIIQHVKGETVTRGSTVSGKINNHKRSKNIRYSV